MNLEELKKQGIADYQEIKDHIVKTIDRGYNDFGLMDKTVVLEDGSYWDYMPEDQLYELNPNPKVVTIY